ncbi:lactate racemase domain-containing protein [Natronosalvus caseinilyticus]|uniref:lactate racemase domain-containing protein n=1 Tax=Natronosalvus caseinilyticus TaxID=2953747 RepID=UPI0028B06FB2|nr:lactate racemase domain-containing protein [Natronosalvus caseinilyticus]
MIDELAIGESTVQDACGDVVLPRMGVIEQRWETDPIPPEDVAAEAAEAVAALEFRDVPAGGEVAVGVGSRGIDNLPEIVRGVVDALEDRGYDPFVVPAMGSHGGATAAGQRDKLETLGVTEASIGCAIRATMDVVQVGETPDRGVPVYADAYAVEADAIVPINRIKPHTGFSGDVESGLSKMLVIGMGKQRGAKLAHDWAVEWSLSNMIPEIADQLLRTLPVAGGVAVVEDQHDDTTLVEGVPPEGFLTREADLLDLARERMPTLPFDELDVLVVDRLGKDVSGQGMDPNVTGRRHFTINEPEPDSPEIKRVFARGLTEKTKGNAMGMGQADVAHRDVLAELDWSKSLINAITASTVRGVRLPPVVETDRAGLVAALGTIGPVPGEDARVLRVTDTMRLKRCYASSPLVDAARDRADLRVVSEPAPLEFDDGQFVAPSPE